MKLRVSNEGGLEERLAQGLGLVQATHGHAVLGVDLERPDGAYFVALKATSARGLRDLRGEVMQLAMLLAGRPHSRACFVWCGPHLPRIDALTREWETVRGVLLPEIADRLAVVAVSTADEPRSYVFRSDESRETAAIAKILQADDLAQDPQHALQGPPREPKWMTVAKILMTRVLLKQGPVAQGELCEQAGCSRPTLRQVLLGLGPKLRCQSNRSVGFAEFPRQLFQEVATTQASTAAQPGVRGRLLYVDRTGQPDPVALTRRLQKLRPPHVALGGVLGARHWDTSFDLRGTPRLDVSLHVAGDSQPDAPNLEFVRRLDPALALLPDPHTRTRVGNGGDGAEELRGRAPVLAIHLVQRPASLFELDPQGGLPWADPVEVLLDLHELRLGEQSDALIDSMASRSG